MSKAKQIVYITGARSDFGRMKYILTRIREHPEFSLNLIVTGMHLVGEFGHTLVEVKEKLRGIPILVADALLASDTLGAMARSLGIAIYSISQHLENIDPSAVLILGDRWESLAGAIASKMLGIPVFHIGGGYRSGSIDDKIRNAITVFSDVHLVANDKCAERVLALGANKSDVHVVGAPDLEAIVRKDFTPPDVLAKKYGVSLNEPLLLVVYHPNTDEYRSLEHQTRVLFEAVLEFNLRTIIVYPNSDPGSGKIRKIINEVAKNAQNVQVYPNIPYEDFLGLMSIASVMIGNSSAGIIEAPSFGLPVVNVGSRQRYRERACNVIDVGYNKVEIAEGISRALYDIDFIKRAAAARNPYGDGHTSERVIKILQAYLLEA